MSRQMDDAALGRLIEKMLSKGKLGAETVEDLKAFQADLKSNALADADRRYVQALAQRLGFTSEGPPPKAAAEQPDEAEEAEAAGSDDFDDVDEEESGDEFDHLDRQELVDRLRAAEARVAELEGQLAKGQDSSERDRTTG